MTVVLRAQPIYHAYMLVLLCGPQDSEGSDHEEVETQELPAAAPDGESTDAESEGSNEELNVHQFLADLEAEWERREAREADLDRTDGLGFARPAEDAEAEWGAETDEDLGMPAAGDATSDEEMEAAGDITDDVAAPPPVQPRRRRLSYKQPAPAAYQVPPKGRRLTVKQAPPAAYQKPPAAKKSKEVLKKPGMLKRPASRRKTYPNERCGGYRGTQCKFDPQEPGQEARVHPDRGVESCIFCDRGRMQEAHAAPR